MSRRNSPNAIPDLGDLSRLGDFVYDKRQDQRASAKKHRRNRHYEKQFIRNTLAHLPLAHLQLTHLPQTDRVAINPQGPHDSTHPSAVEPEDSF